jgi:hypothetical protein
MVSYEIYSRFRFILHAPQRDVWFGAMKVFNDPFDGSLWLGVAHKEETPSVMQLLMEETSVEVWLGSSGHRRAYVRKFLANFQEGALDWMPLDLDARSSEPALEYLRINQPLQHAPEDIPWKECPLPVRKMIDPRYQED